MWRLGGKEKLNALKKYSTECEYRNWSYCWETICDCEHTFEHTKRKLPKPFKEKHYVVT